MLFPFIILGHTPFDAHLNAATFATNSAFFLHDATSSVPSCACIMQTDRTIQQPRLFIFLDLLLYKEEYIQATNELLRRTTYATSYTPELNPKLLNSWTSNEPYLLNPMLSFAF